MIGTGALQLGSSKTLEGASSLVVFSWILEFDVGAVVDEDALGTFSGLQPATAVLVATPRSNKISRRIRWDSALSTIASLSQEFGRSDLKGDQIDAKAEI